MKEWSADHPKAKLMARKRAAILDAAKGMFLDLGYEGASMEAIAATADVSIMTLYRHAESKDDLFAAVVARACDPDDEAEQAAFARVMERPLAEVLMAVGVMAQERLADPETVALMRAVVAGAARFPDLAETAYGGFVGNKERWVQHILASKDESRDLKAGERRRLARLFVDRLFGADMLRVLLGLGGVTATERQQRARRAADEVMDQLGAVAPAPR